MGSHIHDATKSKATPLCGATTGVCVDSDRAKCPDCLALDAETAPAPSLGAGSAGDVEGLAEAMCEGQGGWWNFIQGTRKDEYRRHARAVIESQWLAAHVARAPTADRERLARVEALLRKLLVIHSEVHMDTPEDRALHDKVIATFEAALEVALTAPHVEPSP